MSSGKKIVEIRAAARDDAADIARIYNQGIENQGIEDRVATLETEWRRS